MEERVERAKILLEKGRRHLRAARILYKNSLYGDSLSRSYYVVFSAAMAILTLLGHRAGTHSGLKELFGLHVVRSGLMDKEFGKVLRRLYELRQEGDYEALTFYDEEEAARALEDAERFLKEAERVFGELVKRLYGGQGPPF